jgi:anti-anti-sigma regulatory factor
MKASFMNEELQALRPELEQQITAALTRKSMSNRGTFPPFRIPATAKSLVAGLLDNAAAQSTEAAESRRTAGRALGAAFGQQGLGLLALLEAQTTTTEVVAGRFAGAAQPIGIVGQYFAELIDSFVVTEHADMERQRADMERAYTSTVVTQQEQQDLLRSTIRELSTPISPVYSGILGLPLVGSIDSRRAAEVTERLLEAIAVQQADIVIIDITGVSLIDTSTANHLLMTTRAANLLGSRVVLVGMGPEIAQTIVHLGVELRGLITLADLQAGIAYALGQIGLGIQPLQQLRRG